MNSRAYISIFLVFFLIDGLIGQDYPPVLRQEMDSIYQANITKTRINGVYIPKDLEDAYEEFLDLSPAEALEKFKTAPEEVVAKKLHFGIGRWMIINWSFYEGSRLSHSLRLMGLLHPDDMADFLIIYFHRRLNEKPPKIDALVELLRKNRKTEQSKLGKIYFD
jgi:hypothetical protein